MFVIFCFLLMIRVGCKYLLKRTTDDQTFKIKSVAAQQNVTLECPREKSLDTSQYLYWIRIISGHQLEFLGGTYGFDYGEVNQTPHFTTKQEPGTFILHIHQTQINDTGLYYCIRTSWNNMTFLRGVFLEVKGKSSISSIIQAPPSDAVHPGESVSLQCSVLSDSEKKTCSEDYRVHWFRAGSHQSHPSFIYTHGGKAECGNSSQKCFYNFSKKVNVSDAGTYYCAVAACGEVMFRNGAKLDKKGKIRIFFSGKIVFKFEKKKRIMMIECISFPDSNKRPLNHTEIALCFVCVALAASVTSPKQKEETHTLLRKRRSTLTCVFTTERVKLLF
uniref:Ig-like domain-containing protein n=1 Tax=Salarias fasciatus TaxID=181472 RepID=A0A672IR67_SALFA